MGNHHARFLEGRGRATVPGYSAHSSGKPTMAYSETFTDSKSQMEKKIPRQCRKKKGFEALEVQ